MNGNGSGRTIEEKVVSRSFCDWAVWRQSIQLAAMNDRITSGFPKEEAYGSTSRIRRSAVSVASNIAEGQGRLSTGEFRQFLGLARGSNYELRTQMEIARILKYGDSKQMDEADGLSHEVGKMLYAMPVKTKALTTD